jgi:peptidoglycan hydrolase-like protein with peptidoglycan-binding domain
MALSWPLEQQGSTGENVRSIQYLLNAHTAAAGTPSSAGAGAGAAPAALAVDGIFGPLTAAAVRSFQTAHGLQADGKVGNQTWPVLIIEVSDGSTGDAVRAVQSQLHSRSGWLTIDGIFGPQTLSVVQSFQSFCDFSVDGIVGPITWNGLTLPWLRGNGGQPASLAVFTAWSQNNRTSARYEATAPAVQTLFARAYETGWTFVNCDVAAGTFGCAWNRGNEQLLLEGNDSTGAPFYYVHTVSFKHIT